MPIRQHCAGRFCVVKGSDPDPMNFKPLSISLVLAHATVLLNLHPGSATQVQRPEGSHVSMSFNGSANVGGTEIYILGSVDPRDFFAGLLKISTPEGVKFVRETKEVSDFPQTLTIRLVAVGPVARDANFPKQKPVSDTTMRSLVFKGQWKRGLESRPVQSLILKNISSIRVPTDPSMGKWMYTRKFSLIK
jgi:hypothetical protein